VNGHGPGFIPAIGPEQEIVDIIEQNYAEDGDGRYVEAELAAKEIIQLLTERYGLVT
jgi:hypothetical protein